MKLSHNEASLKMISLTNCVRKSMDELCSISLTNHNSLNKQIDEIKRTVEIAIASKNKIAQRKRSFTKVCKLFFLT